MSKKKESQKKVSQNKMGKKNVKYIGDKRDTIICYVAS